MNDLAPRHIGKVKLVQRVPRLGVLKLPAVLQKRLVADHDHMALAVHVQVLLIVLAARHGFDGALGVADLQLQLLFDIGINRVLGDAFVQPRDQVGHEVVDVQNHAFAIDAPDPFDAGDGATCFGINVLVQGSFEGNLAELDDIGADVFTQPRPGFLKADDATQLKFNRAGRQYKRSFAMHLVRKTALLQLLNRFAHRAATGVVGGHQLCFRGQAGTALQPLGGNAGKQIAIDLVVFGHGDGSMPMGAQGPNLKGRAQAAQVS